MNIFDMIKNTMSSTVPFAAHAGVVLDNISPGQAQASLAQTETSVNHIGTQHSAALFTLAETACGGAIAATFAPVLLRLKAVTKTARIDYLTAGRGNIRAHASFDEDSAALLERLKKEGRVDLAISVSLIDEAECEVGRMTSEWRATLVH